MKMKSTLHVVVGGIFAGILPAAAWVGVVWCLVTFLTPSIARLFGFDYEVTSIEQRRAFAWLGLTVVAVLTFGLTWKPNRPPKNAAPGERWRWKVNAVREAMYYRLNRTAKFNHGLAGRLIRIESRYFQPWRRRRKLADY